MKRAPSEKAVHVRFTAPHGNDAGNPADFSMSCVVWTGKPASWPIFTPSLPSRWTITNFPLVSSSSCAFWWTTMVSGGRHLGALLLKCFHTRNIRGCPRCWRIRRFCWWKSYCSATCKSLSMILTAVICNVSYRSIPSMGKSWCAWGLFETDIRNKWICNN